MADALCPVCNERQLRPHCTSPTCTWHACRNRVCDALLDLKLRRGHGLPLVDGHRRRITLGAA